MVDRPEAASERRASVMWRPDVGRPGARAWWGGPCPGPRGPPRPGAAVGQVWEVEGHLDPRRNGAPRTPCVWCLPGAGHSESPSPTRPGLAGGSRPQGGAWGLGSSEDSELWSTGLPGPTPWPSFWDILSLSSAPMSEPATPSAWHLTPRMAASGGHCSPMAR